MVRRHAGRGVVRRPVVLVDRERDEPELGREVVHAGRAGHGRPRAREPRRTELDRRQRLERVQRTELDVVTDGGDHVERRDADRSGQVHHERAGLERGCDDAGDLADRAVGRREDHERRALPGRLDAGGLGTEARGGRRGPSRHRASARRPDRHASRRRRARRRPRFRPVRGRRARTCASREETARSWQPQSGPARVPVARLRDHQA